MDFHNLNRQIIFHSYPIMLFSRKLKKEAKMTDRKYEKKRILLLGNEFQTRKTFFGGWGVGRGGEAYK